MIEALSIWRDRFLGRGTAAVTVPPLDGALKPNSLLEEAAVEVSAEEPDNLVRFGDTVLFSSGSRIMTPSAIAHDAGSTITAMCASPDGRIIAVSCEDGALRLLDPSFRTVGSPPKPLACVTALAFVDDRTLVACVGASGRKTRDWQGCDSR